MKTTTTEQAVQRMRDYLREEKGIQTQDQYRERYCRFILEGPHINLAIFTQGGPYDNFGCNQPSAQKVG
ncbi:MAG: hypothetical protein IKN04_11170 [Clostridia bacterium]|nr:hypothetical protein [Clostridia bacterium]